MKSSGVTMVSIVGLAAESLYRPLVYSLDSLHKLCLQTGSVSATNITSRFCLQTVCVCGRGLTQTGTALLTLPCYFSFGVPLYTRDQGVFSALESLGSTIVLKEIHHQEKQAMRGWQATSHTNPV